MASRESDEIELVVRAQRGDTAAFDTLVRLYQDLAFRTAWIILRHEHDAQDATQTAFIKAWSALSRFRTDQPFRPWLMRIVANEAKNRRDAQWRWYQLQRHVSQYFSGEHSFSAQDLIAKRETSQELLKAIGQLRENDQHVILLRYALGFTESEMTEILDIPAGTVKSRLHRALNRLKEVMDDDIEWS